MRPVEAERPISLPTLAGVLLLAAGMTALLTGAFAQEGLPRLRGVEDGRTPSAGAAGGRDSRQASAASGAQRRVAPQLAQRRAPAAPGPAEPPADRRPGARRRPRRRALAERRARGAADPGRCPRSRRSGAGAPPPEAGRGGSLFPARTASRRASPSCRRSSRASATIPTPTAPEASTRARPCSAPTARSGCRATGRRMRSPARCAAATASTRTSRARTGRKARAGSGCGSTSAAIRRSTSKGASSSTRSGRAVPTSTPP